MPQVVRSTLPKRAGLPVVYPALAAAAASTSATAQSSPVLPSVERRRRRSDPINRLSIISATGSDGELERAVTGGRRRLNVQSTGSTYQGLLPANLDEDAFVCQTVTHAGARLVLPLSGRWPDDLHVT